MLDAYIKIFDPTGYSCIWRESPKMIPGVKRREEHDKAIKGRRSHYPWHFDSFPSEPFSYRCHSDCYFTTPDKGYGLCPAGARSGDLLVLRYGGNVPCLLRPKKPSRNENGLEEFFFVGECYYNGAMDDKLLLQIRD
jgi:hypothetical protein